MIPPPLVLGQIRGGGIEGRTGYFFLQEEELLPPFIALKGLGCGLGIDLAMGVTSFPWLK